MAFEQIIKLAPVALRQAGRKCDIALGEIEKPYKVIMLKLVSCCIKPEQAIRFVA